MHFFLKRLMAIIPMVLGVTFIAFMLMQLSPGDPVDSFADPSISVQDLDQIRQNLGLDQSLLVQYGKWVLNVVQGNMGYSYKTGKPVLTAIMERLPATLILSISGLALILLIAVPLGLYSGYRYETLSDTVITILSFVGMAMPTFWVGLMIILLFSVQLGWFPTSGFLDPGLQSASVWRQSLNIVWHMILPLIATVVGDLAGLIRYNRFEVIGVLKQDYILAARARGVSEKVLLFKHAFKNAALPLVTILGLSLPGLISGSFIIEYIFSWPGMGQLGIEAVFSRDYPVLMGMVMISSTLILFGNLLADISYGLVDPKIKVGG
jgi:peptide/nickel transport system permease protein